MQMCAPSVSMLAGVPNQERIAALLSDGSSPGPLLARQLGRAALLQARIAQHAAAADASSRHTLHSTKVDLCRDLMRRHDRKLIQCAAAVSSATCLSI
jgi:hypothetical protein